MRPYTYNNWKEHSQNESLNESIKFFLAVTIANIPDELVANRIAKLY